MKVEAKVVQLAKVSATFSPGAPIDKYSLFAGRADQIKQVINAIFQRGQHVIVFGERGVGKTSLANILSEITSTTGLDTIDSRIINCDATDDFTSLWKKVFREMSVTLVSDSIGFNPEQVSERYTLDGLLSDTASPDDIRYVLQSINRRSIIIIDEIDRIRHQETTTLLADTIKTLSDHSINSTLILVGVADSVDDLVAEHRSIERSLVQIRMPRMSTSELFEILDKALNNIEMSIDNDAKRQIGWLSQGLPHYTHLLGLHAAQSAVDNDRSNINMQDVEAAIRIAVDKGQQSILSSYIKATTSPRKETLYSKVLLACALAQTDDLGYFAAADVRGPMIQIMGKPIDIPAFSRHLNDFCDSERGPILQKKGSTRKFRFRFINPMMQPFVVIHGLAKGVIPTSLLEDTTITRSVKRTLFDLDP